MSNHTRETVGSLDWLRCPSNTKSGDGTNSRDGITPVGYACNGGISTAIAPTSDNWNHTPNIYGSRWRVDTLARPANLWVFADTFQSRNEAVPWTVDDPEWVFAGHIGATAHWLFADGHLKVMRPDESATDTRSYWLANRDMEPASANLITTVQNTTAWWQARQ